MPSSCVDVPKLASVACDLLTSCYQTDNEQLTELFNSNFGSTLVTDSMKKLIELAGMRIRNVEKNREFTAWLQNRYRDLIGDRIPDRTCNLVREVCLQLLHPHKSQFWKIED